MKRHWLRGRTKDGRGLPVLLSFLVFATLVSMPTAGLSQRNRGSPATAPVTRPASSGASSASQGIPPQAAPNATPVPYFHLIGVLCSGLIISAARLARKFRRFWGLGVFTNPYAVLFLIFGVGVCGFIPVTSEGALKALPFVGYLGPWIADFAGIAAALVLPAIRFRRPPQPVAESQVADLDGASSPNPILALIEDAIRECILRRMQKEVVEACRRYDWVTIRLAAGRALEEEMTIRPLSNEKYDDARQSIENFRGDPDPQVDSTQKYKALLSLLRWCSFHRLRSSLDAAATEIEP